MYFLHYPREKIKVPLPNVIKTKKVLWFKGFFSFFHLHFVIFLFALFDFSICTFSRHLTYLHHIGITPGGKLEDFILSIVFIFVLFILFDAFAFPAEAVRAITVFNK